MRAYRSICPDEWIEKWQELRESGEQAPGYLVLMLKWQQVWRACARIKKWQELRETGEQQIDFSCNIFVKRKSGLRSGRSCRTAVFFLC